MKQLLGVTIGAGFFSHIQQEAWRQVEGVRIAAVSDHSIEKARQLADRFSLAAYEDTERMLQEVRPDFVDICTPPASHLEVVRLCIRYRIPILCQKPVAPTWEDSLSIVVECQAAGIPLMINENWRWQCWYREMKALIEAGVLGDVYHASFMMRPGDGWGAEPYPLQPYFRTMPRFLLYETGIHWLDTYRYLFGEIDSVYCSVRTVNKYIAGEDHAIVHMNFKSGVTGIYDANRVMETETVRPPTYGRMTVEGTGGRLRLDEEGRLWLARRGESEKEHPYMIRSDGWRGGSVIMAQQHFADGLRNLVEWETDGREYLLSVKAMYACYQSARTGQAIRLDEYEPTELL